MCNKRLCKFMGFVTACWLLCPAGCGSTSSGDGGSPAQGGSAGTSATGGSGGSGGTADAGLGGSAGSSGTGGSAGSSTGGNAGQADSEAGTDASDDEADASQTDDGTGSDVSSDGNSVICPSCNELLTWDTTQYGHSSYGGIHTGSGWDDSYAWQMLSVCPGWSIYEGHEGGIGNTLEIGSCGDGLVLQWAYSLFSSVQLEQGWTGKTDKDMVIGSSYQDFVQTYPDYTGNSLTLDGSGYASLSYANGLAVFKNSVLSELSVW